MAITDGQLSGSKIIQRIEENFKAHPKCAHCHSDHVRKFGHQLGRQRYPCKGCCRTLNCLTDSPLANLKATWALDQYLDCMTTSMTLRPSTHKCGILLDTSFHWRHRLMSLIENDQVELLTGIVELDETFFKESRKGERHLNRPARKRGGEKRLCSLKKTIGRKKPEKICLFWLLVTDNKISYPMCLNKSGGKICTLASRDEYQRAHLFVLMLLHSMRLSPKS